MSAPKHETLFIDIDGTLLFHKEDYLEEAEILDGVLEFLEQKLSENALIILTTARHPSHQDETKQQLAKVGIQYHILLMGIHAGVRTVINDTKPTTNETAKAIVVERNKGLRHLL